MKLGLSLLVFALWLPVLNCSGQEEKSLEVKLAQARGRVSQAQVEFDKAQELFDRGSLSSRRLRDFRYRLDKLTVELAILAEPERLIENQLLGARLTAHYATEIRELYERLEARDLKSSYDLKRAVFDEEVAVLKVEFFQNHNDTAAQKVVAFKIAAVKVRWAKERFEITEGLYRRGSESKFVLERAQNALKIAEEELEFYKSELGASAEVVD